MGAHAGIFDRLLAAIGEEHGREAERLRTSVERRQTERLERLLAGELLDTSEIAYEFGGWHVGIALGGSDAGHRLRELAADLDCRLLCVPREEGAFWAWLGARRRIEPDDLLRRLAAVAGAGISAAGLGEPGEGLPGWRLTSRQAAAALPIAERGSEPVVRYRDVALLTAVYSDELLAVSLRRFFLEPLEAARDGETLRQTLRVYLAAERNVSATASALNVTRKTVNARLRAAERCIGRSLSVCSGELETALRVDELAARTQGG